ncbi:MAG: DUF4382 domain-containing protein [Rikenella sp.]|nr:DUF4382 domain-containing protein [Rikenella sp.]
MVRKLCRIFGVALFGLLLGACDDANDRNQLAVYLCDSPADYGGVDCYVESVEVRSGGEWIAMEVPSRYFAMMELVNGKMQEAGRATLPSGGRYDAVRIGFATEGNRLVIAGESFPLAVSESDAEVVVEFPAVTMDGPDRPLLFDLDIASSVVEDATAESGYRFRPQVEFVDVEACGAVQGGFQIGSAAVQSRLWIRFTDWATGEVRSTYCALDPAGAFFMRLLPGEYTLEVIPGRGTTAAPYSTRLSVERRQVTDLGTIVLGTNDL